MGREIKNNPQEALLTFAMAILIILGVIGGAGSLNWGVRGEGSVLYVIAGIVAIFDSIMAGLAFYKKYLKPE
jgi:hypothetical protein